MAPRAPTELARGYYEIDSVEDAWNTARIEEPNLGYKPSFKGGYFPVSSTDTYHDLRAARWPRDAKEIGIMVEAHHHEVATAGRPEIDMKFHRWFRWPIGYLCLRFHLQERCEAPHLIQTWIDWERSKELDPIWLRPHPHEFSLSYDS